MRDKKGLSMIVTSLIIILLVLVAVGILYVTYINFVRTGTGGIDIATKCINVDVRANAVNCTDPSACKVTLTRTASGENITGVKLVFKDATNASDVIDVSGNIAQLATVTKTVDSGFNATAPNKVEVTVYFEDEAGNEQLCSQTNTYTFV